MLRQIFVQISRIVKKVESMAESIPAVLKQGDGDEPASKKAKLEVAPPMSGRLDRKRKVALLVGYCGAGYFGVQRNAGYPTIEEELIKALLKTELIPQEHAESPQKMSFQRASRTDKGVSAAGNIISLKMLLNKDNIPQEINKHLPAQIRVFACTRGTKGFDGQHHCSHRTYTYMLPTYSFAPFEKFITEAFRIEDETMAQVGEILAMFQGTHNFHNYTSGVKPDDPSAKRYIIKFECSKPFVRDGIEFATLTVKGQSFMLHHIRKMIGLTTAIVKGYCGKEVIEKSWQHKRLDIPKVPGVGLFLEKLHFDGYNKKYGVDGMHEAMSWDHLQDEINTFKEEYIIKHILTSEKEEKVMFRWLPTLQYHTFDVEMEEGRKEWHSTLKFLRNTKNSDTNVDKSDTKPTEDDSTTASSDSIQEAVQTDQTLPVDNGASTKPETTADDGLSLKDVTSSVCEESQASLCEQSVENGSVKGKESNGEHLTQEITEPLTQEITEPEKERADIKS